MTAADHILSVTELNRRARQLLEVHLATVWVRGEISNLSMPSSGHWYFTLKDDKAQIRCAMFRGNNALLRFKPEHGMQVIARGRVSLYEGRGDYQLIAENLQVDGAGNLQIAFEQLKAKLEDERLFDDDFKQELPTLPKHVGVITSPTGAAIRDILSIFKRRFPAIQISIFPVPVQGADAAPAIIKALQLANKHTGFDALILARGGGSLEDLWAFNEEAVARAVFASEIPVVSAIGHETDFTICDFVADIRAATPSAAAELLSPDIADYERIAGALRWRAAEATASYGRCFSL
jgi:exodeoxyribonuclease VII large subunit